MAGCEADGEAFESCGDGEHRQAPEELLLIPAVCCTTFLRMIVACTLQRTCRVPVDCLLTGMIVVQVGTLIIVILLAWERRFADRRA